MRREPRASLAEQAPDTLSVQPIPAFLPLAPPHTTNLGAGSHWSGCPHSGLSTLGLRLRVSVLYKLCP